MLSLTGRQLAILLACMFLGVTMLVSGLKGCGSNSEPVAEGPALLAGAEQEIRTPEPPPPPTEYYVRDCEPVREKPNSFRAGHKMPAGGEGSNSISIDDVNFVPERDLIIIEDERVWWESDNDDHTRDDEDDHLFHHAMEKPMCRLVDMVEEAGGVLKVQDSYRAEGVHATRSLHKQGRAVDVTWKDPKTGDNRSLGELARMCWAAGFDWVYFERSPPHIHASVRPDAD